MGHGRVLLAGFGAAAAPALPDGTVPYLEVGVRIDGHHSGLCVGRLAEVGCSVESGGVGLQVGP